MKTKNRKSKKQETIEIMTNDLANYIIETKSTVRQTANIFKIGKSTVHLYVTRRLKDIDYSKYLQVKSILDSNLIERAYRGGEATRKKYLFFKKD